MSKFIVSLTVGATMVSSILRLSSYLYERVGRGCVILVREDVGERAIYADPGDSCNAWLIGSMGYDRDLSRRGPCLATGSDANGDAHVNAHAD